MTEKLKKSPDITAPEGPVFIIVLDGIGEGRRDDGDAVHLARTPAFDYLDGVALRTQLMAHGTHVGMPSDDDMGNSEVGHNALGAGRVFAQGARLVDQAIASGAIFAGPVWQELTAQNLALGSTLHLIGLLSDGNVHSHMNHIFALIREAHRLGLKRLCLHPLLDGRDVGATTALDYIRPIEACFADLNASGDCDYRIASGGGRMLTTMDRYEADWRIVERGWQAHVLGQGRAFASAEEAITTFRQESPGIGDQSLPAFVVHRDGQPAGTIEDGDTVVFFNFRGDRALEITRAFEEEHFPYFDRQRRPQVIFAGMMQYDGDAQLPTRYLVAPPAISRTMGELIANTGLRQLAVAETQKFGHVTYFWNGNRTGRFNDDLERYIEVPSDRVDFSERPWMKAAEVTDAVLAELAENRYDVVRINFANGDMVGHTGNLEAAIIAVEAVNLCLQRLLPRIAALGGVALITADHGNADQMFQLDKKSGGIARDAKGQTAPLTAHTLNPVPCWFYAPGGQSPWRLDERLSVRRLSNVAATVIRLLGYEPPEDYDPSLLIR